MPVSHHGWHSRAKPYSHSFTPERSAVRLAVLRNAPVEHQGFTLALFDSPAKLAVDAAGKVLQVEDTDYQGLLDLANQIKGLPDTGAFRNTWVISQPITSQPIDRILIPVTDEDDAGFEETSVQGYDGTTTQLKKAVGDIQNLPTTLRDLIGLVLEAREVTDDDRDESMIKQVKATLGDVF